MCPESYQPITNKSGVYERSQVKSSQRLLTEKKTETETKYNVHAVREAISFRLQHDESFFSLSEGPHDVND